MKSRSALTPDELAVAAWPAAVGRRLAWRTRVVSARGGRITVEVEDEIWKRNLEGLSEQILANMAGLIGPAVVSGIDFQVGVPRRPMARAEAAPAADGRRTGT